MYKNNYTVKQDSSMLNLIIKGLGLLHINLFHNLY
jgi:hypothetical protein